MGVLSDYFVADPAELAQLDTDAGLPDSWPRIDAQGFGVVPIEALAKRLNVRALDAGPPLVHAPDFEWMIMALTPECAQALAGLSPDAICGHAAALAPMEELEWPTADVERVLTELVALAQKMGSGRMYLWMCP